METFIRIMQLGIFVSPIVTIVCGFVLLLNRTMGINNWLVYLICGFLLLFGAILDLVFAAFIPSFATNFQMLAILKVLGFILSFTMGAIHRPRKQP